MRGWEDRGANTVIISARASCIPHLLPWLAHIPNDPRKLLDLKMILILNTVQCSARVRFLIGRGHGHDHGSYIKDMKERAHRFLEKGGGAHYIPSICHVSKMGTSSTIFPVASRVSFPNPWSCSVDEIYSFNDWWWGGGGWTYHWSIVRHETVSSEALLLTRGAYMEMRGSRNFDQGSYSRDSSTWIWRHDGMLFFWHTG